MAGSVPKILTERTWFELCPVTHQLNKTMQLINGICFLLFSANVGTRFNLFFNQFSSNVSVSVAVDLCNGAANVIFTRRLFYY